MLVDRHGRHKVRGRRAVEDQFQGHSVTFSYSYRVLQYLCFIATWETRITSSSRTRHSAATSASKLFVITQTFWSVSCYPALESRNDRDDCRHITTPLITYFYLFQINHRCSLAHVFVTNCFLKTSFSCGDFLSAVLLQLGSSRIGVQ